MTGESPATGRTRRLVATIALQLAALPGFSPTALAAPPDLTAGDVPGDSVTINLGPTGLRGWIHHVKADTSESRQILIHEVDAGSPADGLLAVDDVILGADGTGVAPVNFASDARKSLARAIADAETQSPAILKLIRWRAGVTTTVDLTLATMGAYSATAPYSCPKSALILQQGLDYIMGMDDGENFNEGAGRYSFGTLSLLASGNPAYASRIASEAHEMVPTPTEMAEMMSDVRDTASTWERGHTLIFLAEYYLATNDAVMLPAIEAYAVNIAKNQSLFGTVGHMFAMKNADGSHNGSLGSGYGAVNSTGLPCFLALLLAKECGLTNPEIEPAIERCSRFFSYYAGKGTIPYGEHEPSINHESNGKSGLAAVAFSLQPNRVEEGKFFAKLATAATSQRERGHTGPFFNYLWAPLGANCGGEEAAAAHFSAISWMLDLHRRWDGGFDYDNLNGEGPHSGSSYHDFKMSTAALLAYALPRRELRITGRGQDPARWLTSADVTEATDADDYVASGRSVANLITDLGNWSPKVRKSAAEGLGSQTISGAELAQITLLATSGTGASRVGACRALGEIGEPGSAPVLAALLTDPENHVRFMAAEAMRYLPNSARLAQLDTILTAAVTTSQPLVPYDEEDPLHFAHGRLGMLLFYSGNAYGPKGVIYNDLTGVDRNLLYPAIRAVAANPIGQVRSTLSNTYDKLTYADTLALADTIVESVAVRSPADKMFSAGIRKGGMATLEKFDFAEGVPLSMNYAQEDGWGGTVGHALDVLDDYAGSATTVVPDPDVIGFLQALLSGSDADDAQAVLDAIAADPNPITLTPLKSIQSIVADSPTLTLPASSTVLRTTATDHAQGDSIFTWRKVHGAGSVSFTPNGTAASADTAIQFDTTPGLYLFEVTMSDSRGLTEVSDTVSLTLYDTGGTLPPNDPPTADAQLVPVTQAVATPITLSGSDPEGYTLTFAVTGSPAHGSLSGDAPDLLYSPDPLFTGNDSLSFEVMDSEGQVANAVIDITVNSSTSFGVALYEPFDYAIGAGVNGLSGGIGWEGAWTSQRNNPSIEAEDNTWGGLPTTAHRMSPPSRSICSRSIGTALHDAGLMNNGSTLWFSYVMDILGQNTTNLDFNVALCSGHFVNDYSDKENLLNNSEGIGVGNYRPDIKGAYWQDNGDGDGYGERTMSDDELPLNNSDSARALIVGKIEWGADDTAPEKLTLYAPGTDLVLPAPFLDSWQTPALDQSQFDRLSIQWKDSSPSIDEIRFGPGYASVLFGNTALPPPTDYDIWSANYPGANLLDPDADLDGDGLTNNEERIWGLDPTSGASVNPYTEPSDPAGLSFTYTRRDPALSGLSYTVWTSPNLQPGSWTEDGAASANQLPGDPDAGDVETVAVTLTATPVDGRLFVRIQAAE